MEFIVCFRQLKAHVIYLNKSFTDSVGDKKDMESHLTDKLGGKKTGTMNKRL